MIVIGLVCQLPFLQQKGVDGFHDTPYFMPYALFLLISAPKEYKDVIYGLFRIFSISKEKAEKSSIEPFINNDSNIKAQFMRV